jgi:hypothetical protein
MSLANAAGYSGKPVWQKLGLKPGLRVLVRGAPGDYAELVGLHDAACDLVGADAAFDIAHVFAISARDLAKDIDALSSRLPATGTLWVSWPKKASKVATDITEDTLRGIALPLGLVDVKVCAIDAVWSGLKLVWRVQVRANKA